MARFSRRSQGMRRAAACSEWLYRLFLRIYPAPFRRVYGSRMAHVFRDSCRDVLQRHGLAGLIMLWLRTLPDLASSGWLERWHVLKEASRSMATDRYTRTVSRRLRAALATTLIAFLISLIASLNLYLLEDTSSLTRTAYSASPLLRFSYDGIYLSALAAGVTLCAVVGYSITQRALFVRAGLIIATLMVALGGFGGLLLRHPGNFLAFFAVFLTLILISLLIGRAVARRADRPFGQRRAAILAACASTGSILLVNVAALVLHTLILNPVSHELYMQGQIGGTHLNFSLIAMGLALLTLIAYAVSLGRAFRLPSHQP